MTKEELRKEFDDLCRAKEYTGDLFDWLWSKLEDERRTGRQEWERLQLSKIDDLEAKLKAKDEIDEIDTAVRLYAESQAKLKAADDLYAALVSTGLKWEYIVKALEHYKSLKP